MSGFKREYTDPKEVAKDLLKVGVGKLVEKGFKKTIADLSLPLFKQK